MVQENIKLSSPCSYSERLLRRINHMNLSHNTKVNVPLIKTAIRYAIKYHGSQKRASGEPFYSHPIEVSYIVLDYCFDTDTVVSAILHDIVEDTKFFLSHVGFVFGEDILDITSALTDLDDDITNCKLTQEVTIYKKLKKNNTNKKALIVKLADRLHNMRTIKYLPENKQKEKATETIQTFVPFARFVNLPKIESELKTLALNTLSSL